MGLSCISNVLVKKLVLRKTNPMRYRAYAIVIIQVLKAQIKTKY